MKFLSLELLFFFVPLMLLASEFPHHCNCNPASDLSKLPSSLYWPLPEGPENYILSDGQYNLEFGLPWKNDEGCYWGKENHVHAGIDINRNDDNSTYLLDDEVNTTKYLPVFPVYRGRIIKIGNYGDKWKGYIIIEHEYVGNIFTTLYAHVDAIEGLHVGQEVSSFTKIGEIEDLRNPYAKDKDHLHLGLMLGRNIDNGGVNDIDRGVLYDFQFNSDDYRHVNLSSHCILSDSSNSISWIRRDIFYDVDKDPDDKSHDKNILSLYENGIVSGNEGLFNPLDDVKRGELIKMVVEAAGFDEPSESLSHPFNDLDNHWAESYISLAFENEWVSSASFFRPEDSITRAEAGKVLLNALNLSNYRSTRSGSEIFDDVLGTGWENEAAILYENKIMNGYDENQTKNFKPNNLITRAEAATVIVRAFDLELNR